MKKTVSPIIVLLIYFFNFQVSKSFNEIFIKPLSLGEKKAYYYLYYYNMLPPYGYYGNSSKQSELNKKNEVVNYLLGLSEIPHWLQSENIYDLQGLILDFEQEIGSGESDQVDIFMMSPPVPNWDDIFKDAFTVSSDPQQVKALLQKNLVTTVNQQYNLFSNNKVTNGYLAIKNNWNDILKLMINYKKDTFNIKQQSSIWLSNQEVAFNGSYPLVFFALYYGNVGALQLLLQYGVKANQLLSGPGFSKSVPLLEALITVGNQWPNASQSASILLKNGAQTISTQNNQSLFIAALKNKSDQIAAAFLQNSKKPYVNPAITINGVSVLLYACQNNLPQTATALITAGAKVNTTDSSGMTPLLYAVKNSMGSVVTQLLAAKVNVNVINKQNQMALDLAIKNNNSSIALALLTAGASLNDSRLKSVINFNNSAINNYLITMGTNLLTAIQNNNTATALQYIEQIAAISLNNNIIIGSVTWTKNSVLDFIGQLQNSAYEMPSATPLMVAVLLNNPTLVAGLLGAGANPAVSVSINQRPVSPLTIATLLGYQNLIQPFTNKNPISLFTSQKIKNEIVTLVREVSGLSSSQRQQDIPQVLQNQPATSVNQNPDWVAIGKLFETVVIQK